MSRGWTVAMYERLLELDGQTLDGISQRQRRAALRALSAYFPDVETAKKALVRPFQTRRRWLPSERRTLVALYPHVLTSDLARALGRTQRQLYSQAKVLGISKTLEFHRALDEVEGRRLTVAGERFRFRKGHKLSPNCGVKGWDAGGRSHETRFKKGQRNWRKAELGAERVNADGYRDRKVADTGYPPRDWRAVHLLLWEEHHGPVPAGYAVKFANGDKTDIRIDNLELIDRRDLAPLNRWGYSPEITQASRALGKLKSAIQERCA